MGHTNFNSDLTFSNTHHCAWPTIYYSVFPVGTKSEGKLRTKENEVLMSNSKYQMLIPTLSVATTKAWGKNHFITDFERSLVSNQENIGSHWLEAQDFGCSEKIVEIYNSVVLHICKNGFRFLDREAKKTYFCWLKWEKKA